MAEKREDRGRKEREAGGPELGADEGRQDHHLRHYRPLPPIKSRWLDSS
jgi:hypothetical protein